MHTMPAVARRSQRGMLLLGVLVFLAILGMSLGLAGQRWADARQRDDEAELLKVGLEYQRAIESYYMKSPKTPRQYPTSLGDLLEDPRYPMPVRHLRKLYRDPMAPDKDWGLVQRGSAIVGVYSQAPGAPFRTANFDPGIPDSFGEAGSYADWKFVARGTAATGRAAAPGVAASGVLRRLPTR